MIALTVMLGVLGQTFTEQYPALSRRIPHLAERAESRSRWVRYQLMGEVGSLLPHPEAERFLRGLALDDTDPLTRQQALARLVTLGYRMEKKNLPRAFSWPGVQDLDRSDPDALKKTLDSLRGAAGRSPEHDSFPRSSILAAGPEAGHVATVLGLLGDESDIARLKPLLGSENVYVQFSASNALINLGDVASGIEGLNRVAASGPGSDHHHYVMISLLALHRLGEKDAIDRYIAYLAVLEGTDEFDTQRHHATGLKYLGEFFGVWRDDARGWKGWLDAGRR